MWDNAPLLRFIANMMFAGCALAVLYGALRYAVHVPSLLPLQYVRLEATPQRVMPEEVLRVVREEVDGNLLTVNIDQLRQSLERLPWVRHVNIRRHFPDALVVSLEEHQPLARWNNNALVNQQGEVFVADSELDLPDFIGPTGTSAEVKEAYVRFSQQIAGLDLQVRQLALTPRHAWQMKLDSGVVLELGREEVEQRLARFVTTYPYSLANIQGGLKYVDLRYRNGFAIKG
jgi:cell division protein FtsQ